jgi:hypothetical protein
MDNLMSLPFKRHWLSMAMFNCQGYLLWMGSTVVKSGIRTNRRKKKKPRSLKCLLLYQIDHFIDLRETIAAETYRCPNHAFTIVQGHQKSSLGWYSGEHQSKSLGFTNWKYDVVGFDSKISCCCFSFLLLLSFSISAGISPN